MATGDEVLVKSHNSHKHSKSFIEYGSHTTVRYARWHGRNNEVEERKDIAKGCLSHGERAKSTKLSHVKAKRLEILYPP